MSNEPVLIGMSYSPWTDRARWALDHHRIPYRYREHLVMVGMPELRFRTGQWLNKELTVPVLCGREGVWMDSWNIARHAEETGHGRPLFGSVDELGEIQRVSALGEEAVNAMRALVMQRIPRDKEAMSEALDPVAPRFAHGMLGWVVRLGTSYLAREFDIDVAQGEAPFLAQARAFCLNLRHSLAASGGHYLLGAARGFSYADIVMATSLQGVKPVEHPSFPMRPATRAAWTSSSLVEEFQDLLAWRDRIYREHRTYPAQHPTRHPKPAG